MISSKVGYGAVAGSITVLIVWLFQQFLKISVPPEVASSFTMISTFVVSWLVPDAQQKDDPNL